MANALANIQQAMVQTAGKYANSGAQDILDQRGTAPTAAAPKQNFFNNIVHSVASIPGGAVNVAKGFVGGIGSSIGHSDLLQNIPGLINTQNTSSALSSKSAQSYARVQSAAMQYKSGKITKDQYNKILNQESGNQQNIATVARKNSTDVNRFKTNTRSLTGDAALLLPTLGVAAESAEAGEVTAGAAARALPGIATKQALNAGLVAPSVAAGAQTIQHPTLANAGNAALVAATSNEATSLAGKAIGGLKNAASKLVFNNQGVFDKITLKGGQTVNEAMSALQKSNPTQAAKYEGTLRQLQDHLLGQTEGSVPLAAKKYAENQAAHGLPSEDLSLDDLVKNAKSRLSAATTFQKTAPEKLFTGEGKSLTELQGSRIATGKVMNTEASAIRSRVSAALDSKNIDEISKVKSDFPDFFKNPNNNSAFNEAVSGAKSGKEFSSRFNQSLTRTTALFTKDESGNLAPLRKNGFHAIVGPSSTVPVRSASEAADRVVGQNAKFAAVGGTIRRAGLSPEGVNPKEVASNVEDAFQSKLQGTEFEGRGKQILTDLQAATTGTKGIFDPRLLKLKAIQDALSTNDELVTADQARTIRGALDKAYISLPLGQRSFGEKLTDTAIHFLPGERQYLKAQGYGKFTGNPIFWVKRGIKTEAVGQAQVAGKPINLGGFLNRVLGMAPETKTMQLLRNDGLFSKFSSSGDEADLFGNVRGTVLARADRSAMDTYRQQTLGQMAEKFAKNNGTTVEKIFDEKGPLYDKLHDLSSLTTGYGSKGYLTSNLAKTMNVLVFPSRFETKVAMAGAKWLAKSDPIVRLSFVKGTLDMQNWLKSPRGKQWSKDNSEAIGLLNYFTPVETFGSVISALEHPLDTVEGRGKTPSDLGAIGGLPFGIITTILQHQGINAPGITQSPYRDPKTGLLVPSKIPITERARAQQALTDLISNSFAYPGRTAGLGSKTSVVQGALPALKPNAKEVKTVGGEAAPAPTSPSRVPGKVLAPPAPGVPTIPRASKMLTLKSRAPKAKKLGQAQSLLGLPPIKH